MAEVAPPEPKPRPMVDRRQRPNRWRTDIYQPVPGVPKTLPSNMNGDQYDCLLLRIRLEELSQKLQTQQSTILEKIPPPGYVASPEPEPIYDPQGKRLNTREQRWKDKFADERQQVIERAMAMNPLFRAPADYLSPGSKRTAKLYIPYREHPEYNFIGLIIGPRGNTQKRMERETGAKIVIRGRGSQKSGKGRAQPGDDDELHVLVSADTQDSLERAVEMVKTLLMPVDETKNEHKRAQLRELAEINGWTQLLDFLGTLRDQTWLEAGGGGFDWNPAGVQCSVCGDMSHITADCPLKGTGQRNQRLESEFDAFLSEIGEAPLPSEPAPTPSFQQPARTAAEDDAYAEFQKSLGDLSKPSQPPMNQQGGFPPFGVPPGMPPPPYGNSFLKANFEGMPPMPYGMPIPGMPPGMPIPPQNYPPPGYGQQQQQQQQQHRQ